MSKLVFVLCEDRQQEVFVRQWLSSRGFRSHDIRVGQIPAGSGSGAAYVQREYPSQVKALRQVNSHDEIGRALVTVIDADTFTVQQRHEALDNSLIQDRQERRDVGERIAIFVPKRNIETWIYYLQGENIDEENIYRKLDRIGDCKDYVKNFVESSPDSPLKVGAPESLQTALGEIRRII